MGIVAKTVDAEVAPALRRTSARWLFIAPTLFLLVVINQLDKTNISVIIANRSFLSDMGLAGQPARIGLLSTVFFVGYGLGLFAWGFVVDWLGPRRAAMIGVFGWAITTMWCAVTTRSTELYAARFVLGLTEGSIWPVCNKYCARWFPASEQGRIQSLWVNGTEVGTAVGLPIVTYLILLSGWRSVFWVLGGLSLVLMEPVLFFLAPEEPAKSPYANESERRYIADGLGRNRPGRPIAGYAKLPQLLGSSSFWMIAFCQAATVATLYGLITWIPTYLTQGRGLPFAALRGWVALAYVLPVAGAMLMGYFADRTMRPAMVGGLSDGIVAIMLAASLIVPNLIATVLLMVTVLAAPVICGAMNASIMQELAMPEQLGRATGMFVGIGNLIGALGPVVMGYLIGLFKGQYAAAFGFIVAANLAATIPYFVMDRRSKPLMAAGSVS